MSNSKRNNKKERQEADRDNHKARRKQPDLGRKPETIPQREKILIVCEGKNTEPSYFEFFRSPMLKIKEIEIKGTGCNRLSLVKFAKKLKDTQYSDYEVWCVFDADPTGSSKVLMNFKNAIKKAESLGFNVAYSHQAFEYWLLLHFEDHQGSPMHRNLYDDEINKYLKAIHPKAHYDGKDSKLITEEIFNILQGIDPKTGKSRQTLAIERAEKIYNRPNYNHQNPAEEESSTTVFKLVKKLIGKE